MTQGQLSISDLQVGYEGNVVLKVDDLHVQPGEFLSVLGPSGCGKTTLLNTIAGFFEPISGGISVDGVDITRLATHKRNLGLVFQNYALFPHMTVADNLDYGLKIRKINKTERKERIEETLEIVGMQDFAARYPRQLSGGQQQRVALARALVIKPNLLLLDEPLSNLDAKLRRQMRQELREIQKEVGTTMIFVTHDQTEALTMSDRIAVFANGTLEQLGTPEQIYRHPQSAFVADFVGAANIFTATVHEKNRVNVSGNVLPFSTDEYSPGDLVTAVIRPEKITVTPVGNGADGATVTDRGVIARVEYTAYAGESWQLRAQTENGAAFTVAVPDHEYTAAGRPQQDALVELTWSLADTTVMRRVTD